MAKRSGRTPLYELMKRRRERGDVEAEPAHAAGPEELEGGPRWLGPGRTVRVPVGYLLVAFAAVVLLLAILYMIGYWRGGRDMRAEYDARFLEGSSAGDPAQRARDPLAPEHQPAPTGGEDRPAARPGGAASGDEEERPLRAWGPVDSDPRQAGEWYLILAETQPEGARRLAQYCRDRGLEAYMVVSHNNPLRRCVIVLPGLTSDAMSDPREQLLREEVYRVGDAWQATHRGERNLRDAYLHLYEG
jgi:hypothetical protein